MNSSWVAEWLSLVSPADPGLLDIKRAQDLKLAHLPASLFRYRPFSTAKDGAENLGQRTLAEIRAGEVWLSRPDGFNDPYDSAFCVLKRSSMELAGHPRLAELLGNARVADVLPKEEINEVLGSPDPLRTLGHMLNRKDPTLSEENLDAFFDFVSERSARKLQEMQEDMGFGMREGVRIGCFSTSVESVVMWSHYASAHGGLCIEYNVEALPMDSPLRYALCPVIYGGSMFDAATYFDRARTGDFNNLWLTLACLHKSAEWSYEQEWRIVLPIGLGEPRSQQVTLPIKAVHLGARALPSTREAVERIAGETGVPLRRMSLSKASFVLISEAA